MAESDIPNSAPATALLPQFESELYRMISSEVEGLSDEQLDFETDKWEWSKWSIRRNLSHVASGDFRWLLLRWGPLLFPNGLPEIPGLNNIMNSPYDRRLDEVAYWEVASILAVLRRGLELCQSVLAGETVATLRSKELRFDDSGNWAVFAQAHPRGIRWDTDDPSQVYITLEATLRHRVFEHTTHLYNIQRLKRAQGLTPRVEIPFEGYFALPTWDRSEP
jgi:hypothetical protein